MFELTTMIVGPFMLFKQKANKGDFMYIEDQPTVRQGVRYTGADKVTYSGTGIEPHHQAISHNSIQVFVRGRFQFDAVSVGVSVVYEEGQGGFRMGPPTPWTLTSLTDNSRYCCFYPNDRRARRWGRVVNKSNKGDVLLIPNKEQHQFLIICAGSVSCNGIIYTATDDKPVSMKIMPGNKRRITVEEDNTVWLRAWPIDGKNNNVHEADA